MALQSGNPLNGGVSVVPMSQRRNLELGRLRQNSNVEAHLGETEVWPPKLPLVGPRFPGWLKIIEAPVRNPGGVLGRLSVRNPHRRAWSRSSPLPHAASSGSHGYRGW